MSSSRDHFHLVALDDIAFAQIIVTCEGETALIATSHFLDVVLEALELAEFTLMDDHVLTQQTHATATLDEAFGDIATGDLASLRDVEDLTDFRIAQELLAMFGRNLALYELLYVIRHLVDDGVVADVHTFALCQFTSLRCRTNVERHDDGIGSLGQLNVAFRDLTDRGVQNPNCNFFVGKLLDRRRDCFSGTLHVSLDEKGNFLLITSLNTRQHLIKRSASATCVAACLSLMTR
ncbi:hypothetical protein A0J51_01801 [Gluconobacter japonicus]|nr:hypothetical protein A0J51_01801 [Gluconobacter japonicus]